MRESRVWAVWVLGGRLVALTVPCTGFTCWDKHVPTGSPSSVRAANRGEELVLRIQADGRRRQYHVHSSVPSPMESCVAGKKLLLHLWLRFSCWVISDYRDPMDCHPWREDLPVGQGRWKRATSRCDGVITATSVLSPNYAGTPALTLPGPWGWTMGLRLFSWLGSLVLLTCRRGAELWACSSHEVPTLPCSVTLSPCHQFLSQEPDHLGSNPTDRGLRVDQRGEAGCALRPPQHWAETGPPCCIIWELTEVCLLLTSRVGFVNSSHMFLPWLVIESCSVRLCLESQSGFPWHLCDPGQMHVQGRAAWPPGHRKSASERSVDTWADGLDRHLWKGMLWVLNLLAFEDGTVQALSSICSSMGLSS